MTGLHRSICEQIELILLTTERRDLTFNQITCFNIEWAEANVLQTSEIEITMRVQQVNYWIGLQSDDRIYVATAHGALTYSEDIDYFD